MQCPPTNINLAGTKPGNCRVSEKLTRDVTKTIVAYQEQTALHIHMPKPHVDSGPLTRVTANLDTQCDQHSANRTYAIAIATYDYNKNADSKSCWINWPL